MNPCSGAMVVTHTYLLTNHHIPFEARSGFCTDASKLPSYYNNRVSIVAIKHHDHNNLERKGLFSSRFHIIVYHQREGEVSSGTLTLPHDAKLQFLSMIPSIAKHLPKLRNIAALMAFPVFPQSEWELKAKTRAEDNGGTMLTILLLGGLLGLLSYTTQDHRGGTIRINH